MSTTDPRVDAYIDQAAPFAQEVLRHWRALVHDTCPEVTEAIKWGFPHFVYRDRPMTSMAAFKAHCAIGFWDEQAVGDAARAGAMGQFGRLTALKDLPNKTAQRTAIRRAMTLIEQGVTPARSTRPATPRTAPDTPEDLTAALRKNAAARKTFDGFPPGQKREYVDWLEEAKKPETRARRLAQAVEWMAEGKRRHWKYQDC